MVNLIIEQPDGRFAVLKSVQLAGFLTTGALMKAVRGLDSHTRPSGSFIGFTRFGWRAGQKLELWRNIADTVAPQTAATIKAEEHNFKRTNAGEWLYGYRNATDWYAIDSLTILEPGLAKENEDAQHKS